MSGITLPVTEKKIFKISRFQNLPDEFRKKNNDLITSDEVVRNNALIYEGPKDLIIARYKDSESAVLTHLDPIPYAIIECKRVGVMEEQKKVQRQSKKQNKELM